MELLLAVLAIILVLVVGAAVATIAALRRQHGEVVAAQGHAVEAAVASVLLERQATAEVVAGDRAATVEAVVQSAVQQAAAALDARLSAGSAEIEQRMQAGSQALDQRMLQGTQELALRTELFEKKANDLGVGLQRVNSLVEALRSDGKSQQTAVLGQLQETQRRTSELHQTADQLRTVLASPKSRGQWGERMAEDVLTTAGFSEGINYLKQTKVASGGIPDFTFLLPRGLQLHMDAKFPIDNYVRFLEASGAAEAEAAARQFRSDVRQRVKEIQGRGYIDPETTVDTVLLFIPNESVYAFLHENDAEVIDLALKQKVVMCSPVTLFSVLAVIRQSVDNFRLEQRSSEILVELDKFQAEWGRFSEHLDKTDRQLATFLRSFEGLASTRRKQLERSLKRIDDLEAVQDDIELPGKAGRFGRGQHADDARLSEEARLLDEAAGAASADEAEGEAGGRHLRGLAG